MFELRPVYKERIIVNLLIYQLSIKSKPDNELWYHWLRSRRNRYFDPLIYPLKGGISKISFLMLAYVM